MADASLLRLDMYKLIENQEAMDRLQKEQLAFCLVCLLVTTVLSVIGLLHWHFMVGFDVFFMGLMVWGRKSMKLNQVELQKSRQALEDVYNSTGVNLKTPLE